jgi:U32 family peptidase
MKTTDFELLLPVGQKEMAEAAIQNGADAIYVGFPGFNARGRSYDFELEELKHIIQLCHLNGVKVNLAFNIVIFENELPLVIESIKKVLPLKPDALIVQDLGLVRIIKDMCPDQVVHASTQMTITNDLAIELLENLNIKRFVLGRENSLSEIKLIAERTKKELEVFVHGALCVSYSGQCFTSETLGGRSANRGQCAQSCRFSYDLIVDGQTKNLVDRTYLVSPKDLCGIAEVPELMKLGVKSFKVEGRLKSPEYVAQVAKSYRSIIDRTVQSAAPTEQLIQTEKNKMAVEYSRGFFPGWLNGVNHQELVDGTFGSHRGLEIGKVVMVQKNSMTVELNQNKVDIENGDGLLWFENGQKNGGSIYSVDRDKKTMTIEFSNSTALRRESMGSLVYLNHDKSQKKEIEKSLTDKSTFKKIPVAVCLKMALGKQLVAEVSDGRFLVTMTSESELSSAQNKPLTEDMLFDEFSSTANTVFKLDRISFKTDLTDNSPVFLNHKEIKNLRQKCYAQLTELRRDNKVDYSTPVGISDYQLQPKARASHSSTRISLNVLLRNKEQVVDLVRAIELNDIQAVQIQTVCLDFEFGRDYKDSVDKLRQAGLKVGIATTRILKPQEYINLKIIHSMNPDFILVRNLGALYYFKNVQKFNGPLKGDFSLNVTNHKTFEYLIESGLDSVCLSYDLNFDQTVSLLKNVDSKKAEITIHQSMPSFHMEHCVYAAFLSKGKSFKDCGKPCEKHKVQLKDQFGNYHWIKPDQECRNTMYNSSAQTALPYLDSWKNIGLGEIRYEALHETGVELIKKVRNYIQVLDGHKTIKEALVELQATEVYGLSPRQLNRSDEYQARKKDHSFL